MSQFPGALDVFTDKTGADVISSSDPNNAFNGIEAIQGLIGALGEPQTWSTTLMTLLRKYRRDLRVEAVSGVPYVRPGEAVLENSAGNKWVFRQNAASVTIGAGNLDIGSLATGTYYVYATGGSATSTMPIVFSTSGDQPSGIGTAPFYKLGWFYNAGGASLVTTYAGNIKHADWTPNVVHCVVTTTASLASSVAYATLSSFDIPFVSNGRFVEAIFIGAFNHTVELSGVTQFQFKVDGVAKTESYSAISGDNATIGLYAPHPGVCRYGAILASGPHNFKLEWNTSAATSIFNNGSIIIREW